MVDAKKIAVAGAAVVLISIVTIFASSYMSDFNNVPSKVRENKFEIIALGSETASVTIMEVGDYQCEMCKLWFEKTRPQIIENYVDTGKVNLIFLDMPFLGAGLIYMQQLQHIVQMIRETYWDYHVKLYQLQQHVDDGWANADRLRAIAFSLDLNMETFDECMNSKEHYSRVAFHKQKASVLILGQIVLLHLYCYKYFWGFKKNCWRTPLLYF